MLNSLARTYAERFCEKYSDVKIDEKRVRSFKYENTTLINGESIFGPCQIWPAQLEDFAYEVSESHSHRKFNYPTLRKIILLERPEVIERSYISRREYLMVVEKLFDGCALGMKRGKIIRIINRKIEKEYKNSGFFAKIFARQLKIENPQIFRRIKKFGESCKNSGLGINYDLEKMVA